MYLLKNDRYSNSIKDNNQISNNKIESLDGRAGEILNEMIRFCISYLETDEKQQEMVDSIDFFAKYMTDASELIKYKSLQASKHFSRVKNTKKIQNKQVEEG